MQVWNWVKQIEFSGLAVWFFYWKNNFFIFISIQIRFTFMLIILNFDILFILILTIFTNYQTFYLDSLFNCLFPTLHTAPASQTSVSMLNLLMLLLLSLTTVAQLLNFLGSCGGGNDSGGSSRSASSRQLSADSKSIRSDVESPPIGYFTMCWPAGRRESFNENRIRLKN